MKGLDQGYNIKIDISKYTLAVHGFSFTQLNDDTNISFRSPNGSQYWEGQLYYAYKQGSTWWLKGHANGREFYIKTNKAKGVKIKMGVIIYRNDFITKIWSAQNNDMAKSTTKQAPLPFWFLGSYSSSYHFSEAH